MWICSRCMPNFVTALIQGVEPNANVCELVFICNTKCHFVLSDYLYRQINVYLFHFLSSCLLKVEYINLLFFFTLCKAIDILGNFAENQIGWLNLYSFWEIISDVVYSCSDIICGKCKSLVLLSLIFNVFIIFGQCLVFEVVKCNG